MRAPKKAVKVTPEMGVTVRSLSFSRFSIEYDYDESRSCDTSGCDSVCRCSKMEGVSISDVSGITVDVFDIKEVVDVNGKARSKKYKLSDLENYCIQRLMVSNGCYDKHKYTPEISNGYYGEELVGFSFENEELLISKVGALLKLPSDIEKILYVLNDEYGYIADLIINCKSVNIVRKNISEISPSSGALMLKVRDDYLFELASNDVIGVLLGDSLLVDGNHRFAYVKRKNELKKGLFVSLT